MKLYAISSSLLGLICGLCCSTAEGNPLPVEYGWTISDSPSDPFSNTGSSQVTVLYLHYHCTTFGDIAGAEFDLGFTYGLGAVAGFNAWPPFLNNGGNSNLLLQVVGSPLPSLVAGQIICVFFGPDELCIIPSAANGVNQTFDSEGFGYPNRTVGYSTMGGLPSCDDRYSLGNLCYVPPVSVEGDSWGRIKSLYR